MTDHGSFKRELRQVLDRHNDLLQNKEDAGRAAAICITMADHCARPRHLDVEIDVHESGSFANVGYPEAESLAMLGSHNPGDWLDEMEVDVKNYKYIEVGVDDD